MAAGNEGGIAMDLDKGQLEVYYQCEYEIDAALDKALEEVLEKHGYHRWASGCDLTNGVRDLAFDRPKVVSGDEALQRAAAEVLG